MNILSLNDEKLVTRLLSNRTIITIFLFIIRYKLQDINGIVVMANIINLWFRYVYISNPFLCVIPKLMFILIEIE